MTTTNWVGKAIDNGWSPELVTGEGLDGRRYAYWRWCKDGRKRPQPSFVEDFDARHDRCVDCGEWCNGERCFTWGKGKRCFTCDHWAMCLASGRSVVLIDDNGLVDRRKPGFGRRRWIHYMDGGPTTSPNSCKGHGGARWKVRKPDGTIVDSDNWWCQGEIPKHLRDRFEHLVCELA